MSTVNKNSISSKLKTYMNSSNGRNKIAETVEETTRFQNGETIHTPEETALKFITVLKKSINSSGLSENAIKAISDIKYQLLYKTNNHAFVIRIYFSGDMSRPSLDKETYGNINDIAVLFNNGVDHVMNPVKGMWHGKETWSRTVIPGAHFIEQAITDFINNYASEYNVVDIATRGL